MTEALQFWVAVSTFFGSLVLLIFDRIDKTIVVLLGALIVVTTGVLSWEEALHSIDFETIVLLLGLMLTVVIAQYSGIFSWLNVKIANISGGNPLMIFLLFSVLTFVIGLFLNNVTVILLVVPVAIALAKGLAMDVKLMVIGLAMFTNIGGALTLIGDPPNTLIGVKAGLSFNDFLINMSIPVVGILLATAVYLVILNWKSLKPISKNLAKVFVSNLIIKRISYQFAAKKLDRYVVIVTLVVIFLTVLAFMFQLDLARWFSSIGLFYEENDVFSVGVLGMLSGVILALLVSKKMDFMHVVKEVEWDSLLFFSALFIQVGALQQVGFLGMIANFFEGVSGNIVVLLLVILWGIGIVSAVINNIPLIALMIPVIMDLQEKMAGDPNVDLLWWALALAGCLGGNATIIASSSGVLAVDIAKKQGVKITFWEFMKVGVPVTLISLVISSIYLIVRATI